MDPVGFRLGILEVQIPRNIDLRMRHPIITPRTTIRPIIILVTMIRPIIVAVTVAVRITADSTVAGMAVVLMEGEDTTDEGSNT